MTVQLRMTATIFAGALLVLPIITPHSSLSQAAPTAAECLAAPAPACVAELALDAAKDEPEGWAITAAYESLLQYDPDSDKREAWLKRYETWATSAKVDGIKERILPVRAEHLTRKGDFEGAYKVLGLDKDKPDGLSDPTTLILDEARAGRVKEALARIDKLVEADQRDDVRLELVEIAIAKAPADADAVATAVKGAMARRTTQALMAGSRGDAEAIAKSIADWVKGAKPNLVAPFDDPATALRDSWDAYLRGAIAAKSLDAFKAGLAKRPPYAEANDVDGAGRLMRALMREGRSEWITVLVGAFRFPEGDVVAVDEDVAPMRALSTADMLAVAQAAGGSPATKGPVTDIIIELLASRGDVKEARSLFEGAGRLDELNKVTFDQERIGVVFETFWRALAARESAEALDGLAKRITSDGAKAYMSRVAALKARLAAVADGSNKDEPAEDEWAIITEMAQGSGNWAQMVKVAQAIKEPGLRATALVQVVRLMWEKGLR